MPFFSINLELSATVRIRAATMELANVNLKRMLQKPFDANDVALVTDIPPGDPSLPDISFAYAMTLRRPGPDCEPFQVEYEDVARSMKSEFVVRIANVKSRLRTTEVPLPVFGTDVCVKTRAFIKIGSLNEARRLLHGTECLNVEWGNFDTWFTLSGLDDLEMPLVLSPSLFLDQVTSGCALELICVAENA